MLPIYLPSSLDLESLDTLLKMFLQFSLAFDVCGCGLVWESPLVECPHAPNCDRYCSYGIIEHRSPYPRCVDVLQLALIFYVTRFVRHPEAPLDFSVPFLPQPGDPNHVCVGYAFRFLHCACAPDLFWLGPLCSLTSRAVREGHRQQNPVWVQDDCVEGTCPRCLRMIVLAFLPPFARLYWATMPGVIGRG